MTAFQILALVLLAYLSFLSLRNLVKRRGRLRINLMWMVLWSSSATAIVMPDLTANVARLLGIGRGADLIFYAGVLTMLAGFFYTYIRFRQLERTITVLTRHLAITEAQLPDDAVRPKS